MEGERREGGWPGVCVWQVGDYRRRNKKLPEASEKNESVWESQIRPHFPTTPMPPVHINYLLQFETAGCDYPDPSCLFPSQPST